MAARFECFELRWRKKKQLFCKVQRQTVRSVSKHWEHWGGGAKPNQKRTQKSQKESGKENVNRYRCVYEPTINQRVRVRGCTYTNKQRTAKIKNKNCSAYNGTKIHLKNVYEISIEKCHQFIWLVWRARPVPATAQQEETSYLQCSGAEFVSLFAHPTTILPSFSNQNKRKVAKKIEKMKNAILLYFELNAADPNNNCLGWRELRYLGFECC